MSGDPGPPLEDLLALARREDLSGFVARAREYHASDLADVLAALDEATRVRAVAELPAELASAALAEMEATEHPEDILLAVGPDYAAALVEELPSDDAADIVAELPPEEREAVLAEVEDRAQVDRLLTYAEDTAGGLMSTEVVAVDQDMTLAAAVAEIRRQSAEDDDLYDVYAIDGARRLVGTIPVARLVVVPPDRRVREVMVPPAAMVRPEQDQEEVARVIARYNVPAVPVVDADSRLLGRITFDDVIDVVEAETTEDLLKFSGVDPDEELAAPWQDAVRSRLPWLMLNLVTAFLAALVVFAFRETLSRIVLLAVWMPVIAGLGGNAGTQALAVTVRRLALGQVPAGRALPVIRKELRVGAVNGLASGIVVALAAALLGEGGRLGLVVLLALWGNMVVAGFAGAFIPLVLVRLGADPAVASSIFVTAFTDICGFFLLLGLGASLLL